MTHPVIGTRVRGAAGCVGQIKRTGTVVRVEEGVAYIKWDKGVVEGTVLASCIWRIAI